MLGPDKAGNLVVVLDHKREALRMCSDHPVWEEERLTIQDGAGPIHV